MLMSTSSDFLALCREQIALLTQIWGASLTVVYLTQELVETPAITAKLIPVVVYPETAVLPQSQLPVEMTTRKLMQFGNVLALPHHEDKLFITGSESSPSSPPSDDRTSPSFPDSSLLSGNQIVLPLIYEGVMMGLLVTGREDRSWSEHEQGEIQRIAQSLAIACILDQRRAWLQQQLHQHQIIQEQQRDLLDNLLHQFRNPLTAIHTFGKLLLKRFRPVDPNRDVASSIVRESDRLKELLKQFEQVIDLAEADVAPLAISQHDVFVEATVHQETKPALLLPGTGEKITNCSLPDLLKPLLLSAQAIAQEGNIQLITNIPVDLPLVKANIKALQEVVNNIIDNALKYTPAGGSILIEVAKKRGMFQGIAISDTGPGIPSQDLAHLGERRYRGVQAQTEIPGSGLGMAIAKQLISEMQGEIEVLSPAIHSVISSPDIPGTTFIIWLPEVRE